MQNPKTKFILFEKIEIKTRMTPKNKKPQIKLCGILITELKNIPAMNAMHK
jgi:hypothetical protein